MVFPVNLSVMNPNHVDMETFFGQSHTDYVNTLDTKHGVAICMTGSVL